MKWPDWQTLGSMDLRPVLRTNRTYLIVYYLNSYNADVGIGFCHSCHHLTIDPARRVMAAIAKTMHRRLARFQRIAFSACVATASHLGLLRAQRRRSREGPLPVPTLATMPSLSTLELP